MDHNAYSLDFNRTDWESSVFGTSLNRVGFGMLYPRDFLMLFYRKDWFQSRYNVSSLPQTWEALVVFLEQLQRVMDGENDRGMGKMGMVQMGVL